MEIQSNFGILEVKSLGVFMQLTINISNEQLFDKILWLLNSFKNDGLEIIVNSKERFNSSKKDTPKGLDFSAFKVESLKGVDGLEYQRKIRDEMIDFCRTN